MQKTSYLNIVISARDKSLEQVRNERDQAISRIQFLNETFRKVTEELLVIVDLSRGALFKEEFMFFTEDIDNPTDTEEKEGFEAFSRVIKENPGLEIFFEAHVGLLTLIRGKRFSSSFFKLNEKGKELFSKEGSIFPICLSTTDLNLFLDGKSSFLVKNNR